MLLGFMGSRIPVPDMMIYWLPGAIKLDRAAYLFAVPEFRTLISRRLHGKIKRCAKDAAS